MTARQQGFNKLLKTMNKPLNEEQKQEIKKVMGRIKSFNEKSRK
jgi:hypothetical protein